MDKAPLPRVSDHAVLRYLQRQYGVPVETIREQLAASAAIGIAHDAAVVLLGRVKIIVRDGVVVTCLDRSQRKGVHRSFHVRDGGGRNG